MLPNCSHLLTDFRTVFVFALGPFLPMNVIFFYFNGNFNGKMANGHFGHLWPSGHWAMCDPLQSKKITHMGRKGSRAKTKTVLKSVSKLQQFDSMPNLKCQTLLNKNHPIVRSQ